MRLVHGFELEILGLKPLSLQIGLSERLSGKVDLLICNPPYVETPDCEEGKNDIRYFLKSLYFLMYFIKMVSTVYTSISVYK